MAHVGSCFCGTVKLEVSGSPEAMGCATAVPAARGPAVLNAFSLWKPQAVRVTSGAEYLATFQKTELSQRRYCASAAGT